MRRSLRFALALAVLPGAALAHTGGGADGAPFVSGLAHPVLGPDHLLAMAAVGLLAGLTRGRARFVYPASFLAATVLGGAVGARGAALPAVEPVILASVVLLGAAAAFSLRPALGLGCGVLAFFGLAHGYAHGLEGPQAGALPYALGFVLATAALHLAGLAAGGRMPRLARAFGAATAAAGLALAFG